MVDIWHSPSRAMRDRDVSSPGFDNIFSFLVILEFHQMNAKRYTCCQAKVEGEVTVANTHSIFSASHPQLDHERIQTQVSLI